MPILFDQTRLVSVVRGYASTAIAAEAAPDSTTDDYAADQQKVNVRKTIDFLLPIVRQTGACSVLDVGCGVGVMVDTLCQHGLDAYGVDMAPVARYWAAHALSPQHFAVVDPHTMQLPFADGVLDFVFSFGVIEHVGTSDGHADRLVDYHAIRQQWLHEVLRVIKPGGFLLIGGPNRNFPLDVAHGPDSRASRFERWLSERLRVSVHAPWGDNFLWGYGDLARYLSGRNYSLRGLSIADYVGFSRVPGLFRWAVRVYVRYMPETLLATGFNPWLMALIRKEG